MTTITWPAKLPAPRWPSTNYTLPKNGKRFEVDDGGPAIQGRFSTTNVRTFTFTLRCTGAQRAILDDFYTGDGACGAVWFSYTDPVRNADVYARFVADKPPAAVSSSRNKWDVSVTLELK